MNFNNEKERDDYILSKLLAESENKLPSLSNLNQKSELLLSKAPQQDDNNKMTKTIKLDNESLRNFDDNKEKSLMIKSKIDESFKLKNKEDDYMERSKLDESKIKIKSEILIMEESKINFNKSKSRNQNDDEEVKEISINLSNNRLNQSELFLNEMNAPSKFEQKKPNLQINLRQTNELLTSIKKYDREFYKSKHVLDAISKSKIHDTLNIINKPQISQYDLILQQNKNKNFKDPEFLPSKNSLAKDWDKLEKSYANSWKNFVWRRPSDFFKGKYNVFEGAIEPNDIKQGLLGTFIVYF